MNSQIKYRKGFKYQVHEDFAILLPFDCPDFDMPPFCYVSGNKLGIKHGYAWDGPSGPAIDTKSFMRGSLIHDVLYEAMRKELLSADFRKLADKLLRDMCIEDGMWKWRAAWVYQGVREGGGPAADPANKRNIYTAPNGRGWPQRF